MVTYIDSIVCSKEIHYEWGRDNAKKAMRPYSSLSCLVVVVAVDIIYHTFYYCYATAFVCMLYCFCL